MDEKETMKSLLLPLIESKALAKALERVPEELWSLSSPELEEGARPTQLDRILRVSLSRCVEEAIKTGKKIRVVKIHKGHCSGIHFRQNILSNAVKVAWLFQYFPAASENLDALGPQIFDRLRELLNAPLRDEKGRIDHRLVRYILSGVALLLDNQRGFEKHTKGGR